MGKTTFRCREVKGGRAREAIQTGGAGMHRSEAEGRFGEAEPAGRSSVCAGATPIGVKNRRLWRGLDRSAKRVPSV